MVRLAGHWDVADLRFSRPDHPLAFRRGERTPVVSVMYPAWKAGACSCTPSQLDTVVSTASTSQYATSRLHDKQPVLTQNLPDEQRSHMVRCFTLAVETFLFRFSGTQLAAWAGIPRAVSLCGITPVSTTPVARQQSALAHFYYSRNWLVKRGETQPQPQLRTQPDSPWLEARGLLARNVEVLLSSARLAWLEKAHCLLLRPTGTTESTSEVVRQRL